MRPLATFQQLLGLRQRSARSSISLMVADDIHMERGGRVKGGRGGSRYLEAYNFLSSTLRSAASARERSNARLTKT